MSNPQPSPPSQPPSSQAPKVHWHDRAINALRWLIFSVAFALIPFLFGIASLHFHRQPITFKNTIFHGELLLVSIAILCESIGDIILADSDKPLFRATKLIIVGLDLLVFGFACYFFSDIVTTSAHLTDPNTLKSIADCVNVNKSNPELCDPIATSDIVINSFAVFTWTFMVGLGCKILVVEKK
jgi:hypothetical protein